MNHARAAFLRKTAAAQAVAASSPNAPRADLNQYELMLAKLAEDRRRLHDVQSMERKAEVKAQIIPDYLPWVEGVIQGNTGQQDDVLVTVMVWMIDAGMLQDAIPLGEYVLRHKLAMPDQYQRTPACVLAEEFADHALKAIAEAKAFDLEQMQVVASLTAEHDMPDEVRAKLHKVIGYGLRETGQAQEALQHLQRALALHDKSGVKKDIERLERDIKNSAKGQPAPG